MQHLRTLTGWIQATRLHANAAVSKMCKNMCLGGQTTKHLEANTHAGGQATEQMWEPT